MYPWTKLNTNVGEYGNTADVSKAITLCDVVAKGLLKQDNIVAVSGVGAGFIFGTIVMKWY